jgi:nucleoid DNA-binding protein
MNILFIFLAVISIAAAYALGFIHGAKRTYEISERKVVTFHPSKVLRKEVN